MNDSDSPKPAPLWRQLVAMIYDGLLIIAMCFIAGFGLIAIYGPAAEVGQTTIPPLVYQATVLAIIALFYGTFWLKSGQTLGMQAWKIKLVAEDGGAVTLKQVVIRLAGAWLSWAPLGLGYWWSLVDREGYTWHDRLSKTRLLRVPKRVTGGGSATAPPPASTPQ